MPAVETTCADPRADRYLNQLCDHLGRMADGCLVMSGWPQGVCDICMPIDRVGNLTLAGWRWSGIRLGYVRPALPGAF